MKSTKLDPTTIEIVAGLAEGRVAPEHCAGFQQLFLNSAAGHQLQRAIIFQQIKQKPNRYPNPVTAAMVRLDVSRSALFNAYARFKKAITTSPESQDSDAKSGDTINPTEEIA